MAGDSWVPPCAQLVTESSAISISATRGSLGGAQDPCPDSHRRTAACTVARHAGAHEGAALESPGPPGAPGAGGCGNSSGQNLIEYFTEFI